MPSGGSWKCKNGISAPLSPSPLSTLPLLSRVGKKLESAKREIPPDKTLGHPYKVADLATWTPRRTLNTKGEGGGKFGKKFLSMNETLMGVRGEGKGFLPERNVKKFAQTPFILACQQSRRRRRLSLSLSLSRGTSLSAGIPLERHMMTATTLSSEAKFLIHRFDSESPSKLGLAQPPLSGADKEFQTERVGWAGSRRDSKIVGAAVLEYYN